MDLATDLLDHPESSAPAAQKTAPASAEVPIAVVQPAPIPTLPPELLYAIAEDDVDATARFIALGAPVRARNAHGQCALACAASHGYSRIVRLLLDAGADANGLGVNDHPLLTLAAMHGHAEVVRMLLSAGADPNARRRLTGEAPLLAAAAYGHTDTVQALLDGGADVNVRTEAEVETDLFIGPHEVCGETPLHHAAARAPRDTIDALLAAGADRHARTILGETPQSWARRERRDRDIIRVLTIGMGACAGVIR
ncbi:MAG: ankyrin repeat domain-containing protein [Planctomycetes bacterium]|nr:ankyrin repeat domain-containing protein [Planctomycetota bacterium]